MIIHPLSVRVASPRAASIRAAFFAALLPSGIFACSWIPAETSAQDPAPQYRVLPLDPNTCNTQRAREKNDQLNPERFDVAGVKRYYRECLFARLTQENAVAMNEAREELNNDIELVERRARNDPRMLEEYNRMVAEQLTDIIAGKDQEGRMCHPSARVIAAVTAGRLNRQSASSSGGGLPDPEGTKILIRIYTPTENDGMIAATLTQLRRHWLWPGMDAKTMELARKRFISNTETFLAAQKPAQRGPEEDAYLKELMIENLAIIASSDTESAKLAQPLLLSLITPTIQKQKSESEWLVEMSVWSYGQLIKPEVKPEDLRELEMGTIKFLQASLKSWNQRCAQTSEAAPTGGYPGGGGPGGPGAGGRPGGGGLAGGAGAEGGDEGGKSGGPGGGAAPRPKNPYDEQPKEVQNARRILQQRLEKIHYALNGYGKANSAPASKGLIVAVADDRKQNLATVILKIEALQKALNDDKISSLPTLSTTTRRPIYEIQQACLAVVGDDGTTDLEPAPPEETTESAAGGDIGDFGK